VISLHLLEHFERSTSGQVRIRDFALLHVCGWRKTELLSFLLREAVLLMLITVLLSTAVSFAMIQWEGLDVPPARILVVIPVSAALFLLSSLFPAWQASRVIPSQALQHTYALHTRGLKRSSLTHGGYALRSALRRPIRALATLLVVMLATGLFAILFFLQDNLDGLLTGTFLGEHLAVQVQSYHWAIAILAILLSLTCVAEVMLLNTHERKMEINILKAVGWRPVHIFNVFIREAAWLTLTGGLLGMMVSSLLFFRGYGFIPSNLVEVTLITLGVALGAGISAAALPAYQAARSSSALIHTTERGKHDRSR
jgi:predicted lysophospholipase L1 biosynthesis ABC-type transport system permease subunit